LSRVTTRNGEAVFEPAGRQTNRMGYSAAKGLLPKMTNEEIRFARSLSEGGYSTVEIRNFIQMQRSSNDKVSTSWSEIRNRQQLENRLKSMSQTNRPAPITIPFGVIGTRINSSQSVSKSQSNVALNLFREHPQSSAISIPITPTNIATRPPASVLPAAPENLGNTHGTSILGRRSKQNGIIDAIFAPVAALPSRKSRTPIIFSTHRDIRQDTDMGNGNLPIWKMPTTTGTVPYTLTTPVGIVDQTVGQTQSTIPVSLTTMKPRQVPRRIQAEDIAPIYPSPRKGKMIWDMPDDNPFREPSQRKRKTKKSTFTETLW
ncbi:MAG: hypothetical protein O0X96_07040, partial [Methanocorpusculum sp.]|nr:hypothetical protein [Methanocorpusculum sp.]